MSEVKTDPVENWTSESTHVKSNFLDETKRPWEQPVFRSPVLVLSLLYVFLLFLLGSVVFLSERLNIPIESFTADPAVTFNAHPLIGFFSYIGILAWFASAVICLFSSLLLKAKGHTTTALFLFCAGLLSMILVIDDLFMFHEAIFPWYFHIPQYLVYAGYAILALSFFYYFRKRIMDSEYLILVLAVFFLGCSVAGDFILPQEGIAYLVEDAFKIFGIFTWFVYFYRTSLELLYLNLFKNPAS